MCPEAVDFELQGSFQSKESKIFFVDIRPCKNRTENGNFCKPMEQIFNAIADLEVILPTMTTYFDEENFGRYPFKPKYNNHYYHLNPYIQNTQMIKVKQNYVVTHDSWLS